MGLSYKKICVIDGNVYEVAKKQLENFKVKKPELAGKNVSGVGFCYELTNRKPFNIFRVDFDRISFDENGSYDYRLDNDPLTMAIETSSLLNHMLGEGEPLPIPKAPIVPTEEEKKVIEEFLKKKYPIAFENKPNVIDIAIEEVKKFHQVQIERMKESYKIRTNGV